MPSYSMEEAQYLTQEELGSFHLSFTARQYAERLTAIRKELKLVKAAIAEHGDPTGELRGKREGLLFALAHITNKPQG